MTSSQEAAEEVQAVARNLTSALNGLSQRLDQVRDDSVERDEALTRYGAVNRRLIRGLGASLAIDVILTVVLGLVGVQAHHASDVAASASNRAVHSSASTLALCQAQNTARAQQVELWEFLLSLGKPPQTAQQKKVVAEFVTHLHKIFAARDCAALAKHGHR